MPRATFCILTGIQKPALTVALRSHLVRWGSDRRRSFGRHPHVGIAHLAESVAAEGGLKPDFRNRYEEKPTYSWV